MLTTTRLLTIDPPVDRSPGGTRERPAVTQHMRTGLVSSAIHHNGQLAVEVSLPSPISFHDNLGIFMASVRVCPPLHQNKQKHLDKQIFAIMTVIES